MKEFKVFGRLIVAAVVLLSSLYLGYAFAAGYLSALGLWLPPPLNLLTSGLLLVMAAYAALRIMLGPRHHL